MTKDPVCGMTVDEKTAKFKFELLGRTYYFCNASCMERFKASPHKYVKT